jgi:hypothetical protein
LVGAEDGTAHESEGFVDVGVALVLDREVAEATEPGQVSFDDPAVSP